MATRPIVGWGPAVSSILGGTFNAPDKGARHPSPRRKIIDRNAVQPPSYVQRSTKQPTVKRGEINLFTVGRVAVPSQGTGRTFMFNPNDISDTKATSWGSIEVPGASHPVYQFGAGGERLITFELYLDGDRGRFGREQARNIHSLSIMDELRWYRSLVYPTAYGSTFTDVSPFAVLFSFGELYDNVACLVKKADWKINYWVPAPRGPVPVRATVSIQLAQVVSESQVSSQVGTGGPGV
jgi:hypothetical protein